MGEEQPLRQRQVSRDVRALGARTRTASGPRWPSGSTGSRSRPGSRTPRSTGDVSIRWYEDGELNVCYNCVDRHLAKRGDQTAILFEGDDPDVDRKITYRELHEKVCKLANVLKGMGVKKGDRVTIYLPMIPEAAYAMLACARIGAPHSVVFGGFSPDSLADRVNGAESKLIITADGGLRGGRAVPLKVNADKALEKCPPDVKVLMFRHTGMSVPMVEGRDLDAGELMQDGQRRLPARADERRGPAVHPLHLGLDRQAQGRCCTPPAAIWSTPR